MTGHRASAAIVALALGACGHPPRVHGVGEGDAVLTFRANVRDAGMWLDGVFVGSLDALPGGVAVPAGVHRLEIRHDDYFAYYAELELGRGERRRIDVELAPVLP